MRGIRKRVVDMSRCGKKIKVLFVLLLITALLCMTSVVFGAESIHTKYVSVLGYEIRDLNDSSNWDALLPGNKVLIKVHLYDPRMIDQDYKGIIIEMDSKAFIPLVNNRPTISEWTSDMYRIEKNGMAVTIVFPVVYTGYSDQFVFDVSYDETLHIPGDTVQINIGECKIDAALDYYDRLQSETKETVVEESDEENETVMETVEDIPENGGGYGLVEDAYVIRTSWLEIERAAYEGASVVAGENFDFEVTILATEGDENVNDIIVSLSLPKGISYADEIERYSIGTLVPGQSKSVKFSLCADTNTGQKELMFKINITGVSSYYGVPIEKTENVKINITRLPILEVADLIVPNQINYAYDDGSGRVSFILRNTGFAFAKNIRIFMESETLEAEDITIELLESQKQENVVLNVIAKQEDFVDGVINIAYESEEGTKSIIKIPIESEGYYQMPQINHNVVINPSIVHEKSLISDWVWFIMSLGIMVCLIILGIKLKNKK